MNEINIETQAKNKYSKHFTKAAWLMLLAVLNASKWSLILL